MVVVKYEYKLVEYVDLYLSWQQEGDVISHHDVLWIPSLTLAHQSKDEATTHGSNGGRRDGRMDRRNIGRFGETS